MTYSKDFREKVLSIRKSELLSIEEVAKRFGISKTTVFNWTKRIESKKTRNRPCKKIDMEKLKKDIEENSDLYQHERAEKFGVSRAGIWYALKRLGVTYKKSHKTPEGKYRRTTKIQKKNRGL